MLAVRTHLEDTTLQRELPGYAAYTARVRHKVDSRSLVGRRLPPQVNTLRYSAPRQTPSHLLTAAAFEMSFSCAIPFWQFPPDRFKKAV
jgi:hypothetical protein